MPVVVWVLGSLTLAQLALLLAFIAAFGGGLLIWIKPIHTCRGTEFGREEGVVGQLLALALGFTDSEAAIAGMVSTTNTLQSTKMRDYRIKKDIYIRARIFSRVRGVPKTTRAQRYA